MPDQIQIGAGTVLKLGDGAVTEAFTAISKLRSIGRITESKPQVDVTNLDSTGREYIGGLTEGDEIEIEGNLLMDLATHGETAGLDSIFISGQARNFELLPKLQSKKIKFAAIVNQRGFGPFTAYDPMTHSWRLKISGAVTVVSVT